MKKLIILSLVSILFVACGGPKAPTESKNNTQAPSLHEFEDPTVTTQKNVTSIQTGGICGGSDNLTCDRGNICVFNAEDPEGKGICDAIVVDAEKECEDTQAPVCGLRKGQKHGFLNKCYLEKHGAEFIADGLCKKADVAGKCDAPSVGIGTCFKTIEAYVFEEGTCQKKYVSGCEAEAPFESMTACESACK